MARGPLRAEEDLAFHLDQGHRPDDANRNAMDRLRLRRRPALGQARRQGKRDGANGREHHGQSTDPARPWPCQQAFACAPPTCHYTGTMTSPRAPIVEVSPSEPADAVLQQAIGVLSAGGVIAFPTDTLYGLGCGFGQPQAIERIQRMRGLDLATRPLTFLLPDMGELPRFTRMSEASYRLVNRIFPGPYCAELLAHPSVPSPFVQGERRTIGVRIPQSALCEKLTWRLGRPILTATAKSRNGQVLTTAAEIRQEYGTRTRSNIGWRNSERPALDGG